MTFQRPHNHTPSWWQKINPRPLASGQVCLPFHQSTPRSCSLPLRPTLTAELAEFGPCLTAWHSLIYRSHHCGGLSVRAHRRDSQRKDVQ